MNTPNTIEEQLLEHLKAEAREKFWEKIGEKKPNLVPITTNNLIDHLIEHTHTQTIQSVRERVEAQHRAVEQAIIEEADYEKQHLGLKTYNDRYYDRKAVNDSWKADLLKDLEAPVEGDNVN